MDLLSCLAPLFFSTAYGREEIKTLKMCGQALQAETLSITLWPLGLPLALACSYTAINDVVTTCWHFTPFIFFQRHPDRRSDPSREPADLDAQEDLRRRRPELHRELARPPDQPDDLGRKRNLLFARRFKVSEQKLLLEGVVVAQLVEWSLRTPEICNLNPDIGKVLSTYCAIE